MKQQHDTQHIEQVRAYLSQRRQQVDECWQDLSALISRLETDRSSETDTTDRVKMEKQIKRLTVDKAGLEQQLRELEQDLTDLEDPEWAAECLDKYPLPLPSIEEIPESLTAIQRHIQAGKDYFEQVTGNIYTGDGNVTTGEVSGDMTVQQAGGDIMDGDKIGEDKIVTTVGNVSGASQVASGKNIQQAQNIQNITYTSAGPSWFEESALLWEAYLQRLFQTTSQIYLTGIDRKTAKDQVEAYLNLSAIYVALLTDNGRSSALDQLNRHNRLVILGDPGSGKSTFVHFVAMCLAGELLGDTTANLTLLNTPPPEDGEEQRQPLQQWQHGPLLPVLVILREFAAKGLPPEGQAAKAKHLWDFIAGELREVLLDEYVPVLQQHLRTQGGLILLDGLDEVPEADSRRTQIKQAVEDFILTFSKCRIVVTSRTYAYQNQDWRLTFDEEPISLIKRSLEDLKGKGIPDEILEGLQPLKDEKITGKKKFLNAVEKKIGRVQTVRYKKLILKYAESGIVKKEFDTATLAPFTRHQIRQFIDHWYDHFAERRGMQRNDARGKAELLKRAIFRSERLTEFAERPLLLTLMASLHAWRGGSLPEKREELYNDAVDLLLDWWESPKIVRDAKGDFVVVQTSLSELLNAGKERVRKALNMLAFQAHHGQREMTGTADIAEEQLVGSLMRFSQNKELKPALLVDYLSERAGLLVPRGVGIYTFPHRTFQEYLAACYLTDDNYPQKIAELTRQEPNRWREVLLLAGAKAARGTASAIWLLADALCWQEVDAVNATPELTWGALLAGQALAETVDIQQVEPYNVPKLGRIARWLMAIFTKRVPSKEPFPGVERILADKILAVLDTRPGIGVGKDGLPDICWQEVPAGEFTMGEGTNEHTVVVSAFQMSRYPVTNAQYYTFVGDGGYTEKWKICWEPDGWDWKKQQRITGPKMYKSSFDVPNHPVVGVSWYEAVAFCHWLTLRLLEKGELSEEQNVRLPTEAEWEKAARGTDGRIYPWGNEQITPEYANYHETRLGTTSVVGCFPRGASPYNCEEMAGNVWEWCQNLYSSSGSDLVLRGGSWFRIAGGCRAADRSRDAPGLRDDDIGFRLVRTPG